MRSVRDYMTCDPLKAVVRHVKKLALPDPLQLFLSLLSDDFGDTRFPAEELEHAEYTHD